MEKQYNELQLLTAKAAMSLRRCAYPLFALLGTCHALAGQSLDDQWGPVTNGAQMSITIAGGKNHIKTGEAFRLTVRIRNISTNEVLSFYNAARPNADITDGLACVVISPSGQDISPVTEAASLGGSGGFANARPGRSIQYEFPLSQLCRLQEIGTYKIMARKRTITATHAKNAVVLTSNIVSLSVELP